LHRPVREGRFARRRDSGTDRRAGQPAPGMAGRSHAGGEAGSGRGVLRVVARTHASGRLRVTVRRYYERLPLSWLDGHARGGRNPDAPRARKNGPDAQNRRGGRAGKASAMTIASHRENHPSSAPPGAPPPLAVTATGASLGLSGAARRKWRGCLTIESGIAMCAERSPYLLSSSPAQAGDPVSQSVGYSSGLGYKHSGLLDPPHSRRMTASCVAPRITTHARHTLARPAHPSRARALTHDWCRRRWIAGSSPAMTVKDVDESSRQALPAVRSSLRSSTWRSWATKIPVLGIY